MDGFNPRREAGKNWMESGDREVLVFNWMGRILTKVVERRRRDWRLSGGFG
jgi:hypothetical protein